MDKARLYALETINSVFNNKEFSNISVNRTLKVANLDPRSEALYTQLVYGVIENKFLLDHYLRPYIVGKDIKQWVRHLLLMSIYQIIFLTRIPIYAVTSDAVNICKHKDAEGVSRLVNGILRSFDKNKITKPENEEVLYSVSPWLFKQIKGQYKSDYKLIFESFNKPSSNVARVNLNKTTRDKLCIKNKNIIRSKFVESAVIFKRGNIAKSEEFINGLVSIQDEASQKVSLIVDPKSSDRILDLCAAPGGKTTHLAELMKGNGLVVSNDIHAHKLELIEQNVTRLGLKNVKLVNHDGLNVKKIFMPLEFDKVLVDAPCSGWGVIRRKPEIKYFQTNDDVEAIIKLQKELLESVKGLVNIDGFLIYSTCTINKGENEVQIKEFLERNKNFKLVHEELILPHTHGTDGFYIAKMKKVSR